MGLEGPRQQPKAPDIVIQGPLALLADGLSIDEQDRGKCQHAMQHWIEHDARVFRQYVSEHPESLPDPSDVTGMRALLEKIHKLH